MLQTIIIAQMLSTRGDRSLSSETLAAMHSNMNHNDIYKAYQCSMLLHANKWWHYFIIVLQC